MTTINHERTGTFIMKENKPAVLHCGRQTPGGTASWETVLRSQEARNFPDEQCHAVWLHSNGESLYLDRDQNKRSIHLSEADLAFQHTTGRSYAKLDETFALQSKIFYLNTYFGVTQDAIISHLLVRKYVKIMMGFSQSAESSGICFLGNIPSAAIRVTCVVSEQREFPNSKGARQGHGTDNRETKQRPEMRHNAGFLPLPRLWRGRDWPRPGQVRS